MDNNEKLERRLAWIEACLRLGGRFGIREKKAYRDRFALTDGMISRDQDAFVRNINERCGTKVVIKRRGKLEVADDAALPSSSIFCPAPKAVDWLAEMLGPFFEVVEPVQRAEPAPSILRAIVQAILDKRALCFCYVARSGARSVRVVSPHAIVHAVGRLHMRGWDHGRNDPRDFVLTRISDISRAEELQGYVDRVEDRAWQEQVVLEVRLREGECLDTVGPDYGLGSSGIVTRSVRKAHAVYLIDDYAADRERHFRSPVSVMPTREE